MKMALRYYGVMLRRTYEAWDAHNGQRMGAALAYYALFSLAPLLLILLAYVKYQAHDKQSLFYLHRIVRETMLERASLFDLLSLNESRLVRLKGQDPQLCPGF